MVSSNDKEWNMMGMGLELVNVSNDYSHDYTKNGNNREWDWKNWEQGIVMGKFAAG